MDINGQFPYLLTEHGNETFSFEKRDVKDRVFTDLDLYNIGLIDGNKVKDIFAIKDYPTGLPIGTQFKATKVNIDAQSLINGVGPRNPTKGNLSTWNNSTNFRVSFVIVQGPNGSDDELAQATNKLREFASILPGEWSRATGGRSTLSVYAPSPIAFINRSFLANLLSTYTNAREIEKPATIDAVINDLNDTLSKTHNDFADTPGSRADHKLNFNGISKFRTAQLSSPNRSRAILAVEDKIDLAPILTTSQRIAEIRARLRVLADELNSLLSRRQQLISQ